MEGSLACSLITAGDLTAAGGEPVTAPVPAGERPAAGPLPLVSGCTVSPPTADFQFRLTVERYATFDAAKARYDPIAARPDSSAIPGIADGAYVQQPPVSAGLLHGSDYVALEGLPRSAGDAATTAAYASLLGAVAAHFTTPAPGGNPRALVAGDFDPCAFATPLAATRTVMSVTRIGSDHPPMAACRIGLGGSPPLSVIAYALSDAALATLSPAATLDGEFAAIRAKFGSTAAPLAGIPDTMAEPGQIAGLQDVEDGYDKTLHHIVYWFIYTSGSNDDVPGADLLFVPLLRGWKTYDSPDRYYYRDPRSGRYYWLDAAGDEHWLPPGQTP